MCRGGGGGGEGDVQGGRVRNQYTCFSFASCGLLGLSQQAPLN